MKNKKVIIVVVVLVLAAAGYFVLRKSKNAEGPAYQNAQAERGTIEITILSTGTVKPETRVDIKPPIAGRAEKVFVKEGDVVRRGQTLALTSSTERAALIDAARAKGPAEEKQWEELYKPVPILAPISGTIILRSIEPGQTFATTDAILAMSDHLVVEAQVDETDIAQVQKGQSATILLDAYPNEKIPGKVEKIAYEATTTNNVTTYHVSVAPEKAPDFMRSGMTANVTFDISKKENIVTVPTGSLKTRHGKTTTLIPAPAGERDQTPREVEVVIGLSDGKKTEIVSGLSEGDTVLIPQAAAAGKSGTNPFMPSGPRGTRGGSGGRK